MNNEDEKQALSEAQNQAQSDGADNSGSVQTPQLGASVVSPHKKSRKKLMLIALLAIVLVGSAAAYWFMVVNKQANTDNNSQNSQTTSEKVGKFQNKPIFQIGNKLVAFNSDTKQAETLTDKLPSDSQVLDFFTDNDDSWRLYYSQSEELTTKTAEGYPQYKHSLGYLDSGGDNTIITSSTDSFFQSVASAKAKVLAYSTYPDVLGSATTKTYLAKDKSSPELIYESRSRTESGKYTATDPLNFLYLLKDISEDGSKLLYGLHSCFECDGPSLSSAFELDIATKKTTAMQSDSKTPGAFAYASDGKTIRYEQNTNAYSLGPLDGKLQQSFYDIASAGASPQLILKIDSAELSTVILSPDTKVASFNKRARNYAELGDTIFDGFYARGNSSEQSSWSKLTVADMPADVTYISAIGNTKNECFGANLFNNSSTTHYSAAICKLNDGYKFYTVAETKDDLRNPKYTILGIF